MATLYVSNRDLEEIVVAMRQAIQRAPGGSGMRFAVPSPKAREHLLQALRRLVPPGVEIEVTE